MAAGRNGKTPVKKNIEPVTDIVDKGGYFYVVTELPGVTEEKIRVDLENFTLTIFASDNGRKYQKAIVIPCEVRFGKKEFRDSVLRITLEKTGS
jgi:HSP20 family molecular chaperone IbpA